MSNAEFVMVPRELADRIAKICMFTMYKEDYRAISEILGRPSEQRHGEPVAWVRDDGDGCLEFTSPGDGIGYPVYRHADPGEVERLNSLLRASRTSLDNCALQIENLQAQLAERDALLRELLEYAELGWDFTPDISVKVRSAISAIAEQSAPKPMPAHMEAACDKFDWTPEEALRFYAEGKHFDTDNGRTRILCTGAIASHALKGMNKKYADLKGSEQAAPSAPVEIDERAEFEAHMLRDFPGVHLRKTGPFKEQYANPSHQGAWLSWQARAALERKP